MGATGNHPTTINEATDEDFADGLGTEGTEDEEDENKDLDLA